MKKISMLAFAAMLCASAFAQGDAIKEIMKAKEYAPAQQALQAALSTMSDEDKAKAYNKLVDLSMAKVQQEGATIGANQTMEQLGKKDDVKPVDMPGYYAAAKQALLDGIACDKYDQLPNAKGKVKPRFHDANLARLADLRVQIVNAGQEALQVPDYPKALDFLGLYVRLYDEPLFAAKLAENRDPFFGQVALLTARLALQEKNLDDAVKYCDLAMTDPEQAKDALDVKVYILGQGLKSHADSVAYCEKMKALYAEHPESDQIFASLTSVMEVVDKAGRKQIIADKLAKDPNNFMALAISGQDEMQAGNLDAAIAHYKAALAVQSDNATVLTLLGATLNGKAGQNTDNDAKMKELLEESKGYLEKAKEIDPNREQSRWSYYLYQCYYTLYGADDPRTKEMEALQ